MHGTNHECIKRQTGILMNTKENENGALQKLKIEAYDKIECSGQAKSTFTAMFNPESFTKSAPVELILPSGQGKPGGEIKFKSMKPQEFSLSFTLDGTGAAAPKFDVALKIKEFFDTAYDYKGNTHKPNYLKLWWGENDIIKCVLKKASVNYTMFKPSGRPLRAIISADFLNNKSTEQWSAEAKTSSPDLTHEIRMNQSDNLPLMVNKVYNSLGPMLEVAEKNELNSLRNIKPGTKLIFPPSKV